MDTSHASDPAALAAGMATLAIGGVFFLIIFIFGLWLNWRIAAKAGYSGAASLLMLIPLVNIAVLCYFAFSEWPIERALKAARGESYAPTVPPPIMPYLPPPTA